MNEHRGACRGWQICPSTPVLSTSFTSISARGRPSHANRGIKCSVMPPKTTSRTPPSPLRLVSGDTPAPGDPGLRWWRCVRNHRRHLGDRRRSAPSLCRRAPLRSASPAADPGVARCLRIRKADLLAAFCAASPTAALSPGPTAAGPSSPARAYRGSRFPL
jgi:hypothetical protein